MRRNQTTGDEVAGDPAINDLEGSASTGPSSRRRAFVVLVVAVAGLMLAACGSGSGPTSSVDPAGPASTGPPAKSIAKDSTKDPTGATGSESDGADPAIAASPPEQVDPAPATTLPDLPVGINPVRLEIPGIAVDAPIIDLDLRGPEPEVPSDFSDSGWYEQTRRPGEIGPSVIAGHVDSVSGPAVFARLDELSPGDRIIVHGDEGRTRTFVVKSKAQYPKQDLPPEVFEFDAPVPELRLITCGGTFDRRSGHYRDNLVVYAQAE